jgi:cytosine permease
MATGSFIAGGLFLAVLGSITAIIGVKARLTSYMLTQFAFGRTGSKVVNFAFAISQFGWFGVQVGLFGRAARGIGTDQFGLQFGEATYVLVGGFIMVFTTMFGFRLLNRLALVVVPLMVTLIAVLLYKVLSDQPISAILDIVATHKFSFNDGVAAAVGSLILGAILIPDVARFAKNKRGAVFASVLTFLIATTFVYVSAAVASLATGEVDTLQIMITMGLGTGAFALIIFSTWTANSINLYGSSLSMSAVLPRFAGWRMTVSCGIVGTLAAFAGILDHFIPFLIYLSILFVPVGSIYITDFFLLKSQSYEMNELEFQRPVSWEALFAWLLGSLVSYATAEEMFSLTGSSTIDALLIPGAVYFFLMRFGKTRAVAGLNRGNKS